MQIKHHCTDNVMRVQLILNLLLYFLQQRESFKKKVIEQIEQGRYLAAFKRLVAHSFPAAEAFRAAVMHEVKH